MGLFAALRGVLAILGVIPKLFKMMGQWFHDRTVRNEMLDQADKERQIRGANLATKFAKQDTQTEQEVAAIERASKEDKVRQLRRSYSHTRL